ncbi:hypothetical protein HYALB_00011576 [Hymenoscyphus albidus]|uniref:Uncharacterized protein n=1 Tax=Hymenoscyphus albidus TaxID=595503 RepID=A0A9N9LHS4_9HELO|nr:hypothetical protein HYALB_00011576 [Hymenoscyphus albidus]
MESISMQSRARRAPNWSTFERALLLSVIPLQYPSAGHNGRVGWARISQWLNHEFARRRLRPNRIFTIEKITSHFKTHEVNLTREWGWDGVKARHYVRESDKHLLASRRSSAAKKRIAEKIAEKLAAQRADNSSDGNGDPNEDPNEVPNELPDPEAQVIHDTVSPQNQNWRWVNLLIFLTTDQ